MSHRDFLNDAHGLSDEARQGLLDNRCEHAPKRHRTKARRIRRSKTKRQRIAYKLAMQKRQRERFHDAVEAYWSGEKDCHP